MSQEAMTFTIGEGAIDPEARIAAGEVTREMFEDMVARLQTNEFFDDIDPDDPALITGGCVDGRGNQLGWNAAGGTFSLVMADALTDQSHRKLGQTAPEHARTFFTRLKGLGKKILGHGDEHAHGPNCGCGAEDKLDSLAADQPSILEYMVRRADDLRTFLGQLGVQATDDQHHKIVTRAQQLRDEKYATNGADLRQVTLEIGGAEAAPKLPGTHAEGVLLIDMRLNKVLNRERLHTAFGDLIDAFYLHAGGLQKSTALLAASPEEAADRFIGALYYNASTAGVLAKNLQVIVRQ